MCSCCPLSTHSPYLQQMPLGTNNFKSTGARSRIHKALAHLTDPCSAHFLQDISQAPVHTTWRTFADVALFCQNYHVHTRTHAHTHAHTSMRTKTPRWHTLPMRRRVMLCMASCGAQNTRISASLATCMHGKKPVRAHAFLCTQDNVVIPTKTSLALITGLRPHTLYRYTVP